MFKAFLRIKKSFKSIDFDLAKRISIFNVKYHWNMFEKISNLKFKINFLGSKFSNNIAISERIRTGKETNTAENQRTTHSRQQAPS